MILNWLLQRDSEDETTFENILKKVSTRGVKKIYLVISCMKDSGYKVIEEELYGFKSSTKVLLGIDKKNTTKSMLEGMMKLAKDVYVYSNNQDKEIDTNLYIFEDTNEAYVYYLSGNLSDGGIKNNIVMYPEIIYNLNEKLDKEKYKEMKTIVEKQLIDENTTKLTKEYIEELSEKREIFSTNLYNNYAVKSISDLLKDSSATKRPEKVENDTLKDEIYDEERPNLKADIKKFDLSNKIDMDIDIGEATVETVNIVEKPVKKTKTSSIDLSNVSDPVFTDEDFDGMTECKDKNSDEEFDLVDELNEEASDLESLIFEKPSIKIENQKVDVVKEEKVKEELSEEKTIEQNESEIRVKKIDLNKVTNFILQLPKPVTKGREKNAIKVPSYVRDLIPHFFALAEKGKNITDPTGTFKVRDIVFELVNVENGDKYQDNSAKMTQRQGQTYLTINADILERVYFEEDDIARIIKLSDEIYRCEIINKKSKEYELWLKMCTQQFKGVERKYGVM